MSDPKKQDDGSATAAEDQALEAAIIERLGPLRTEDLRRRFRALGSSLEDEVAATIIAVRRRAFGADQRIAYGVIRLVQRAGLRPRVVDKDAWDAATPQDKQPAPKGGRRK